VPPFWGVRVLPSGAVSLPDLWPHLDLTELFKLQWGVRAKGEEYERMIREEFGPKLEELKAEVQSKGWLTPRVVYGYFPCHAEGEELVVLDPEHRREELVRLRFPRQPDERHLCLADHFRSERGADVVAFQVVTVGDQASKVADGMQEKGDYSRALYLHGLAVETAEALADFWHARVRSELGMAADQGKRYSPGYPAWPELEDQRKLWKLLDPERNIGVSLTSADQMVPEQSTSAIVLHHPGAVYYTVKGAIPVA
jgi:5-methyltetrahydrofolate--homocysteine methyltransferase